jgi:hypothetical protein
MSNNNVIDVSARFKAKQEENDTSKKIADLVDEFTYAYGEVTDVADLALEAAWVILVNRGIKPLDIDAKDYVLFREAMYSMLLRQRVILHPLQITAEEFHEMVE